MLPVRLIKGKEKRVATGHPWIFSNEIADSFKAALPGSLVRVESSSGRFIGIGYTNPHSLITIRILAREEEEINTAFFQKRIEAAHERRIRLYPGRSTYRLCHSEGDFLPGLIIDNYNNFLVIQVLTAGMETFKDLIIDLLCRHFKPKGIILRNDTHFRALEGLPLEKGIARGEVPERIVIELYGLKFSVNLLEGQKTGFYLDQTENRLAITNLVKGKKVLDAFCYTGAWGLTALHFGAREVTFVDSSPQALDIARESAELNKLAARCQYHRDDVFDFLKNTSESYEVIILDPPAFAKSRARIKEATAGYIDINRKAMEKIAPGGILVTCSCSHHISTDLFRQILLKASRLANRTVRLLERRMQAKDHPVLLSVPETEYLKCFFLEIM